MKRLLRISCVPQPDRTADKTKEKDDAIVGVIEAFVEQWPDCLIVVTPLGKTGSIWNYMVSLDED